MKEKIKVQLFYSSITIFTSLIAFGLFTMPSSIKELFNVDPFIFTAVAWLSAISSISFFVGLLQASVMSEQEIKDVLSEDPE